MLFRSTYLAVCVSFHLNTHSFIMSLLGLSVELLSSIIVLLDIPSAVKCQSVCKSECG